MSDQRLEEQLDAFRPGHRAADAARPELKEAAEKLQSDPTVAAALSRSEQLDLLIRNALEEVPVPEGLAEQLEHAVLGNDALLNPAADSFDGELATPVSASEMITPSRRRWVRWSLRVAVAAAAACLVGLLLQQLAGPAPMTSTELVRQAHQWAQQWQTETDGWKDTMPPRHRSIAATVNMPFTTPWRMTTLLGDSQAVIFRSTTAMLLVVDAPHVKDLGAVPPKQPQFGTGSLRIGAWRSDGLVYVLVVNGDLPRYQSMLQRPFDA